MIGLDLPAQGDPPAPFADVITLAKSKLLMVSDRFNVAAQRGQIHVGSLFQRDSTSRNDLRHSKVLNVDELMGINSQKNQIDAKF